MVAFTTIFTALAMALTTTAAPAPTGDDSSSQIQAQSGSVTYYYPGLGACGAWNGNDDLVAALGWSRFDRERPCNRKIRVSYKGRSVDVKVVDRCEGCAANDVDLSPAAFKKVIGDLGIGRATATWTYI